MLSFGVNSVPCAVPDLAALATAKWLAEKCAVPSLRASTAACDVVVASAMLADCYTDVELYLIWSLVPESRT